MFEEMIESYLASLKEMEGYDVKSVILSALWPEARRESIAI